MDKKLPILIKDNDSFIVVGNGYLDGKSGIIQLLKEQGFNVIPIDLH